MKNLSFFNKGWLCLCIFFGTMISSCGATRNQISSVDTVSGYVEVHAIADDKAEFGSVVGSIHLNSLGEQTYRHYVFRFPMMENWRAEQLRQQLLAMGALQVVVRQYN